MSLKQRVARLMKALAPPTPAPPLIVIHDEGEVMPDGRKLTFEEALKEMYQPGAFIVRVGRSDWKDRPGDQD